MIRENEDLEGALREYLRLMEAGEYFEATRSWRRRGILCGVSAIRRHSSLFLLSAGILVRGMVSSAR